MRFHDEAAGTARVFSDFSGSAPVLRFSAGAGSNSFSGGIRHLSVGFPIALEILCFRSGAVSEAVSRGPGMIQARASLSSVQLLRMRPTKGT